MKKTFLILFKMIVGFISLLFAALALSIIFGVTIDLSFLKPGVEKAATSALNREVKIKGPVVFEFAQLTAINVRDVEIANVPNAEESYFFKAKLALLEINLIQLMKGEILISEIKAEDVTLNLENDAKGEPNWIFGEQKPKDIAEKKEPSNEAKEKMLHFGGLDKLSFKRIILTYHDHAMKKTFQSELESMTGEMSLGKPLSFALNGNINKILFDMKLKGDPFDDLAKKEKPWRFKLEGHIGGKQIAAKGDLLRNQEPKIDMAFGIKDIDIGMILSTLGLVEGMSASVGDAAFKVSLKGTSLQQVLSQSSMFFIVKEGQWKIDLPNSTKSFDITHLTGNIKVEKGNAITMDLAGKLEDEPVKLLITGSPLVEYIKAPDDIPLTINAELAKMKLEFSSRLALPITSKDLKLSLKISGDRLDNLNDLFKLDLPPLGPVDFNTRLHVTKGKYHLSKLHVKAGRTTLDGTMKLDISHKKPKLDIKLTSDMIHINDFDFTKKKKSKEKKTKHTKLSEAKKKKIRKLLSPEVLGLVNAHIHIKAKQVISNKDKLGSGSAKISLINSRFAVEPLIINVPGGGVRVDFSFLPVKGSATVDLKIKIDKFDVGVIARRAKPGTDMGGTLYLDAELHSVTPSLKQMMKNAKGHFDFGLVPLNFSSKVIDLWTVNLLTAIMNKETEKNKSTVNCFIMRFDMQNGLMQDKVVYMDTSNMSVDGEAKVDFRTETLDIMMVPKSKKPEFFSLTTPLEIKGSFDDFGLKLGVGKLLGTVVSFATSPVHVPIRRIFTDDVPADGKDACRQAWNYTQEKKSAAKKR